MKPIEEGCRALIINHSTASGEVTVGKRRGKKVQLRLFTYIKDIGGSPIWEIDKQIPWYGYNGVKDELLPFCAEDRLMRIDGFENKQVNEREIMERVMAK